MMDKNTAIYNYFNKFMSAYPSTYVPDTAELTYPYITFDSVNGARGTVASVNVSIWYKGAAEKTINTLINTINADLEGGVNLAVEGGAVFISSNGVWNTLNDVESNEIKRKATTLNITFNTLS